MCNKVVVECASLGYRRAGLEEGFVEKYSQSFGDAERAAGVFHGIGNTAVRKRIVGLDRHGEDGGRRRSGRGMHERNFGKVLVSSSLMVGVGASSPDQEEDDVPPGSKTPFSRKGDAQPHVLRFQPSLSYQCVLTNILTYMLCSEDVSS